MEQRKRRETTGRGSALPQSSLRFFIASYLKRYMQLIGCFFLGSSKKWRDGTVRVASTEHAGKGYSLYEKLLHRNFTMHQTMMQPVSDAIGRNKGDDQRVLGLGRALEKF